MRVHLAVAAMAVLAAVLLAGCESGDKPGAADHNDSIPAVSPADQNISQSTHRPDLANDILALGRFNPRDVERKEWVEIKICALRDSKVFHLCSCAHLKRSDPERVLHFDSRQAAEATGRRPCKLCLKDD